MIYINKINKKIIDRPIDFILCDFDRTITIHSSHTCWNIFSHSRFANDEFIRESDASFAYYRPKELDVKRSLKSKSRYMKNWSLDVLELLDKYGMNEELFFQILNEENGIILRRGFDNFLRLTNELGIRFYIVSAGIYDVIHYTLDKNNLLLPNVSIISNKIKFTKSGIAGIDGRLLHSCNKNSIRLPIEKSEFGLLFGDQIEDRVVGRKYDTFDIGFCPSEELLPVYNKSFDMTLTDNSSFDSIQKILLKK